MTVLTLPEAKAHLNITGSTSDDELQTIITSAEAVIAQRVGPLEPTTVTATITGTRYFFSLPVVPVISLTSVTTYDTGVAVSLTGLNLDVESGALMAARGTYFPCGPHTVVYQAGRASLPDDLLLAVKEMVRHLWSSQRGGSRRPGSDEQSATSAYLMPYKVQELISPHEPLGIA